MRSFLLGALSLLFALALWQAADVPGKLTAERVVATGDITVLAQSDDRVKDAFAKVRASQRVEATLEFVKCSRQTRTHNVHLTAPDRTGALAELEAFLAAFRSEYGGEFGKDIWTFSSSYAPHVRSAKVRAWDTAMRGATAAMLLLASAAITRGFVLYRRATAEEKDRIRKLAAVDGNGDPHDAP